MACAAVQVVVVVREQAGVALGQPVAVVDQQPVDWLALAFVRQETQQVFEPLVEPWPVSGQAWEVQQPVVF